MSVRDADMGAWSEYVTGELQRFYATTGGETYLFRDTPKARAYLDKCQRRGLSTEEAAFYGAPHMVRNLVTTEFLQWWVEAWGTKRITFTQWQERAKLHRAEVDYLDSADHALGQLELLRRLTLERDALIVDAVRKGASKVAVAVAVGLSRQQVHTIVSAAVSVPVEVVASEWDFEPF